MDSAFNYLGTIDLANRPVIQNPNGSISTERSFSFSPTGQTEILIPQIVNGKVVPEREAIGHFFRTGEHLGAFDTKDPKFSYPMMEAYANWIHNMQSKRYRKK